jgi:hypothetical protein
VNVLKSITYLHAKNGNSKSRKCLAASVKLVVKKASSNAGAEHRVPSTYATEPRSSATEVL